MNLLLVENNDADAAAVLKALSDGGYLFTPQRVQTRDDFLRAVKSGGIELILATCGVPGFDANMALALAADHAPGVPFIVLCGKGSEALALESLRHGATDYVFKHDLDRITPSVRRALREAAERTERRRAQEEIARLTKELERRLDEIQQGEKLKDEFLSVLSHELRSPLTAIFGWTRLLQTGKLSPEDSRHAIEVIEKNTRIQMQLVNDLLDTSRIISGRLKLEMRPAELAPVIEAAIQVAQPFAEARKIGIHAVLARTPCVVSGDIERLQQVLWNLLSNAIKFSLSGTGRVEVRLERAGGSARIHVIDNGRGIPPEMIPKLFERFVRVPGGTGPVSSGLGLGLAIVRHMVELHGGTVHAESAGVGNGATFTITLPLSDADTGTPLTPVAPAAGTSLRLDGLKVLVVEDEPDTRDLLSRVLRDNGAAVQAAASVREAMEAIRPFNPDIVVSDLGMPEEDGYSLARKLKELSAQLGRSFPAIALTAHTRKEDQARALAAGFQLHVPKPVEPAHLVSVVANVARQK